MAALSSVDSNQALILTALAPQRETTHEKPNLNVHSLAYRGLWGNFAGWVLYLFDCAIRVYDEKAGRNFYLNVDRLITELCRNEEGTVFPASKKSRTLFLETINPVIRKKIPVEDVTKLFADFRTSPFMQQMKESRDPELVARRLTALKNRHLEVIPFKKETLVQKLKPGDIIFKKQPRESKNVVVLGQWLFNPLIGGQKERESYKYSHAAIYLGNGKAAEAVPHQKGAEVRILDLDDPGFALKDGAEYLVSRCKDEALAETAAEIGKKTAQDVGPTDGRHPNETVFKYTKLQAMRSIWHPSSFGPFARYRYLKQYHDDHTNLLPKDFIHLKSFFCSYFVGYCFQTAESRRIMPEILGESDAPPNGITPVDKAIFRGLWARLRRIQTWNQMSEKVQLQYDAKRLTPQDLRNFIIGNEKGRALFSDQYLIQR